MTRPGSAMRSAGVHALFSALCGAAVAMALVSPSAVHAEHLNNYIIVDESGAPVEGARVAVSLNTKLANISDGHIQSTSHTGIVRSDAHGTFALPQFEEPALIIVLHGEGAAVITQSELNRGPRLTLKPHGRVEGKVRLGEKYGARSKVLLRYDNLPGLERPYLFMEYRQQLSEDGAFSFDTLPEGIAKVYLEFASDEGMPQATHGTPVDIVAGTTARVEVGGTGVRVRGTLAAPDTMEADVELSSVGARFLRVVAPLADEKEDSPESRKILRDYVAKQTDYAVVLHDDKSFEAFDVPPGDYTFVMQVRETSEGSNIYAAPVVGQLNHLFTVPEILDNDAPTWDLGELAFTGIPSFKVGDTVPAIDGRTLDGEPFRLSDFRGKVVLLDFWATWCGPCIAETPNLKEIFDTYGDRDDFVMIGLSLDENTATPKKYVEENEMNWVQGYLGNWDNTTVPLSYGVLGIPTFFLIDSEGRLISNELRGMSLMSGVRAALPPIAP